MQLTILIRQVYGNETIYPACPAAQTFADMLGQKTLTRNNLRYIAQLGYEILSAVPATVGFA